MNTLNTLMTKLQCEIEIHRRRWKLYAEAYEQTNNPRHFRLAQEHLLAYKLHHKHSRDLRNTLNQ